MVMPITSTKNFRLSSGFGVSNSMWPRWARSKIGSGFIRKSLFLQNVVGWAKGSVPTIQALSWARRRAPLPTLLQIQRPRQIIEQFVDDEGTGNKPLLRRISNNQFQRAAH